MTHIYKVSESFLLHHGAVAAVLLTLVLVSRSLRSVPIPILGLACPDAFLHSYQISADVKAKLAALVLGIACVCLASCSTSTLKATSTTKTAVAAYEVKANEVKGLGRILSNGDGFTLYAYLLDDQGSSKCYEACAEAWPPLVLPRGVTHPVAGSGVTAALLGTTTRKHGSVQVTYNHWPLYLYRDDYDPGMATGQAEGMGAWYVISVDGDIDRNPLPEQTNS